MLVSVLWIISFCDISVEFHFFVASRFDVGLHGPQRPNPIEADNNINIRREPYTFIRRGKDRIIIGPIQNPSQASPSVRDQTKRAQSAH